MQIYYCSFFHNYHQYQRTRKEKSSVKQGSTNPNVFVESYSLTPSLKDFKLLGLPVDLF